MITRAKLLAKGLKIDERYLNEFFLFGNNKGICHWKDGKWKVVDMKTGNPYKVLRIIDDWKDFEEMIKE